MIQAERIDGALHGAAAALGPTRAPRSLGKWARNFMAKARESPLSTVRDAVYILLAVGSVIGCALLVGEFKAEHRQHGADIAALQHDRREAETAMGQLAKSMAELSAVVRSGEERSRTIEARLLRVEGGAR